MRGIAFCNVFGIVTGCFRNVFGIVTGCFRSVCGIATGCCRSVCVIATRLFRGLFGVATRLSSKVFARRRCIYFSGHEVFMFSWYRVKRELRKGNTFSPISWTQLSR